MRLMRAGSTIGATPEHAETGGLLLRWQEVPRLWLVERTSELTSTGAAEHTNISKAPIAERLNQEIKRRTHVTASPNERGRG